jgi:hypothetical protein
MARSAARSHTNSAATRARVLPHPAQMGGIGGKCIDGSCELPWVVGVDQGAAGVVHLMRDAADAGGEDG